VCLGLHVAVLEEQVEAMMSQVEENIEMLDLASDQYKVYRYLPTYLDGWGGGPLEGRYSETQFEAVKRSS